MKSLKVAIFLQKAQQMVFTKVFFALIARFLAKNQKLFRAGNLKKTWWTRSVFFKKETFWSFWWFQTPLLQKCDNGVTGRRHFGPLFSSASFCGANVPIVEFSISSLPETFKWFLGESDFWRSTSFFFFVLEEWGFESAIACSRPARVSDQIVTSQNHSKVEYLETWLFISKLAKVPIVSFWTFWSEKFVKGLFLFRKYPDYKLFLLLLSPRSLCSCGSFSDAKKPTINFSFFSLPEMPGVFNWA